MQVPTKTSAHTIQDSEMVEVAKAFLFDGMPLPVSLYVRLTANTYLMIGKKHDKAQLKELKNFSSENFKIYAREEERFLLTSFIMSLTEKTIGTSNVSFAQNGKFIEGLIDSAFDELSGPLGSLNQVKSVTKLVAKLSRQPGVFEKAFDLLAKQEESTAKHAMLTCLVSLILAELSGMLNNLSQEKLALGALLHDFGLQSVPAEILAKSPAERTPEEKAIYESHPQLGAELLRSVPGMSVEVILIIAEHHENAKGTGYPKGLRDVKMNPLAKIVGLADVFCDLTFPRSGAVFTPDEAIAYIENVLDQPYNKSLFSNLRTLVNKQALAAKMKTYAS